MMEYVSKKRSVGLCLLIITLCIDSSSTIDFSYQDTSYWPEINPQCGGQLQSPISIDYDQINMEENNSTFSLINYDKQPLSATLSNVGHMLKVTFEWDEDSQPMLSGEALNQTTYILNNVHFHWSRVNVYGAEHELSGLLSAIEVHFVHYNLEYGSYENSLNYIDGLAVIAGQVDILQNRRRRDEESDYFDNFVLAASQESPALSYILDNLELVTDPGSSVDLQPFAMSEFRPVQFDTITYIAYYGSLTTPPCTENVLWLLSIYPYRINEEQLDMLQLLVNFDHDDDHNNREIQPTNGREIITLMGVEENTK